MRIFEGMSGRAMRAPYMDVVFLIYREAINEKEKSINLRFPAGFGTESQSYFYIIGNCNKSAAYANA